MALLNCPECSKQVSDQAAACPSCGYPLKPSQRTTASPDQSKPTVDEIARGAQLGIARQQLNNSIVQIVLGLLVLAILFGVAMCADYRITH
jgi:uncharacterized membrane protein YvbJ